MSKHLSPAYQLYSAREDASNDLEGVLDQLSRMGYEGVEFAGFFEKTAIFPKIAAFNILYRKYPDQ